MRQLIVLALAGALTATGASASTLGQRASSVVDDAYLVAAVRAHLVDVDADSATDVSVNVNHGVVTLRGQARTSQERVRYVAAAASVSGVRVVHDEMTVNPSLRGISEKTKDAALAVRVSAAIFSQAGGNTFNISPEVRNGVVILHGTVPSASVERTVVSTTEGLSGVRRVVDDLVIRR